MEWSGLLTLMHRAIPRPVVVESLENVAQRCKNDGQAGAKVIEHINQGGTGRWGKAAMPPFPGLKPQKPKQLADFVIQR